MKQPITMPLFAIVIPTFNRAHLIARAVSSVLQQTHTDLELIVVDDGSTDETPAILDGIDDPRLRVIRQENRGRSVARNVGAQSATAEYVLFLDSDDEVRPEWLERIAAEGAGDRSADLICCAADWFTGDGTYRCTTRPKILGPFFNGLEMQIRGGTFAIRRRHFLALDGYVDGLEMCEHTELALRIADAAVDDRWTISGTPDSLVLIHCGGQTLKQQTTELADVIDLLVTQHADRFSDDPNKLAQYYNIAGVNAARSGDVRRARRFFRSAVQAVPGDVRSFLRLAVSVVPGLARYVWREPVT